MTLRDLWLTIRHYLKWVVIVPIVCALLAGGSMCISDRIKKQNFTATSTLTVADPTALLSVTSLSNLMDALAKNETATVAGGATAATAKSDPATQSVAFIVTGASREDAVNAANDLADRTAELVKRALADQSEVYLSIVAEAGVMSGSATQPSGVTSVDRAAALRSCVFTVSEAKTAVASGSGGVLEYAAVGLMGGLFLVICVLLLVDSVRRPIKSRIDIANVTDLPVLAEGTDTQVGERLWTNVCFAFDGPPSSVCLLPVSEGGCDCVASALQEAARGVAIVSCCSLEGDLAGAIAAREADASVVVVRSWSDRASDLIDVSSELRLARANVVGIVFL